jgi:trehalose 6-phosphate phosphatase
MSTLPHALEKNFPLFKQIPEKKPVVFLDFDGTLTPIIEHPDQTVLSQDIRKTLRELAKKTTVTLLSGRRREELEKRVEIPSIYYGGVHGFDLKGPGMAKIPEEALALLPEIQDTVKFFQKEIKKFPGAWVEDKKITVALHYRLMDRSLVPQLKNLVEQVAKTHLNLKLTLGKKIFELRPKVEWDKGFAVIFLLKTLHLEGPKFLPIFLGDDETDEDAFRVLQNRGWGILVDPSPTKTAARAYLKSTDEVGLFLQRLIKALA